MKPSRLLLVVLFFCGCAAFLPAQSPGGPLAAYADAYPVTALEWKLMKVNLAVLAPVQDGPPIDYVIPTLIHYHNDRFSVSIQINEQPRPNARPFFELPEDQQNHYLATASQHFLRLLGREFPEVSANPALLYISYWTWRMNWRAIAATFENGTLSRTGLR